MIGRVPVASEREDALVRGLLSGIAAFRSVAWAWMATVVLVTRDDLDRPWLAIVLLAAALVVTAGLPPLLHRDARRLLSFPVVAIELAVGVALSVCDGLAYDTAHSQSLGSAWPLAGILTAGVAFGVPGGALAGAVLGLASLAGRLMSPWIDWESSDTIAAISTIVLYVLAGVIAGLVTSRLREAERRIADAQAAREAAVAREEVARTLHDGVLQTLAVVQRRSADPDLAHLARDQERELREYLFGTGQAVGGGDLGSRLRAAAALFEDRFEGRTTVVLAEDLPALPDRAVDALGRGRRRGADQRRQARPCGAGDRLRRAG